MYIYSFELMNNMVWMQVKYDDVYYKLNRINRKCRNKLLE